MTNHAKSLMEAGAKALAIVAFEGSAQEASLDRYHKYRNNTTLTSLLREMPSGYVESLQFLIQRFTLRQEV